MKVHANNKLSILPSCSISNKVWKLNVVDITLKDMYVSFAAVYTEKIDSFKFINSLKTTLLHYHFFYGKLINTNGELSLFCNYEVDIDKHNIFNPVLLEINNVHEDLDINNRPLLYKNEFISTLVPNLKTGKSDCWPLLQIKLTNFNNTSIVGITWNHAVSDFKGIYNFISHISKLYNNYEITADDIPVFERNIIWGALEQKKDDASIKFSRIGRNNIVIISKLRSKLAILRYAYNAFFNYIPTYLFLNTDKISTIKNFFIGKSIKVSTNDIINATLIKLFLDCMNYINNDLSVGVYFPIDIRSSLNISNPVVANCLGNASALFKISDLKHLEIRELAVINRTILDKYDTSQFIEDLIWAEYWRSKGSYKDVYHHWLLGKNRIYSSNWASFGMHKHHFGKARLHSILRSSSLNRFLLFPAFHATILPCTINDKKHLAIRMTIHKKHLKIFLKKIHELDHIEEVLRLDTGEVIK